ncbi:ATP-binding protein [Ferruginibacter sp. HRS2-29]|uniref:ATP-binding protein n=1 Tax=Ferruginibacter sp. HRS2-29 TaxID=2487334 RepID=UPI0020CBDC1E|nr:ATP-binding protein [Ferruginibacter sp. HRS2-29]MCP9750205.1 ATP-binding protein [Ferruginibacter sp. HRS2-29]
MARIKIKDFGPIKIGFTENSGFLSIKKVTVFIGNQGTGKSSIAKLISTFTWLEKALYRGDVSENEVTRKNKFEKNYCDYHRLKDYFQPNTEIEYKGDAYSFHYVSGRLNITSNHSNTNFLIPKIMYVPAERNFLSAVSRPEKLKGLPLPLYTFLEEFDRSQQELSENLDLPIGNLKFQYQKLNKIANIIGDDYKIKLLDASSGIQSSVPLFLVSRNLSLSINKEKDSSRKEISIEEEKKIREEIKKILSNNKLSDDLKKAALEVLSARYKSSRFINIVEEIEQNLFPKSQKEILFKLLEFANYSQGSELILTTHSPYIINYLTLAIKADSILKKINNSSSRGNLLGQLELIANLNKIVPTKSCISSEDAIVYELSEDGKIVKLNNYEGIPSDENYLNQSLAETNQLFDDILEIEELL